MDIAVADQTLRGGLCFTVSTVAHGLLLLFHTLWVGAVAFSRRLGPCGHVPSSGVFGLVTVLISCCLAFPVAAYGVSSLGFRAVLVLTTVTDVCCVRSRRIFPLNFPIVQGLVEDLVLTSSSSSQVLYLSSL